MTEHRIYFIGENGRIVGVDDSAHLEEADAIARAQNLASQYPAIEVWRGADVVAKFNRDRDHQPA